MIKLFHYFFIWRAAEIVRYEIDGTLTYFEKIRVNHQAL